MNFEKFFRLVSYAAVFCGFLSLWVSGTFGVIGTAVFGSIIIGAWLLEGSRWQITEKIGTALIVLALPSFYLAWRLRMIPLNGGEAAVAGVLARMILSLTAIKLLQKKSDRDWIFLYLMSFFEVLLAAGLSISPLYLASFLAYLLVMVCAVIAFEIRKTSHAVEKKITGKTAKEKDPNSETRTSMPVRRLPSAAIALIVFIAALAIPLFFMLPRVGGAGFGGYQQGLNTQSGFSDSVQLGRIGRIQQNDEIVMRVKLDPAGNVMTDLYFRGVALDTFDNKSWSKSKPGTRIKFEKGEGDVVQVDLTGPRDDLTKQTIYLEPLDTPVLFALPRAVSVQGSFPELDKDAYGALSYLRSHERISYTVLSDRSQPAVAELRSDDQPYTADVQNYRNLPPRYDIRIAQLAETVTANAKNRYDKARAVESYLQNNFGYTLEQKAGGEEPLADFLFNVREGHCEYFATAMAVMLRTQGIATRIVNGFHGGEYNDAAGTTVVRARNAHAWVEVYFPKENAWVPFDPTPASEGSSSTFSSGIAGTVNKYVEALETFWIEHFVAYDNEEQRSLARNLRDGAAEYQTRISSYLGQAQAVLAEWWAEARGDKGMSTSLAAIGYAVGYMIAGALGILLFVWMYRTAARSAIWRTLWDRFFKKRHASIVEFYDRMQRVLANKGLVREPHQTPLEFAFALGLPEAVNITEKYNRVRFGEKGLSSDETAAIETWLQELEAVDEHA